MADMQDQHKEPVSRNTRRGFCWGTVVYCLGINLFLVLGGYAGPLVEILVSGHFQLALMTAGVYVTGSVVDRNGGFGNMFKPTSRTVITHQVPRNNRPPSIHDQLAAGNGDEEDVKPVG